MYVIEKFQMGIYLLTFNQFLSFVADTSPAGHLASSILCDAAWCEFALTTQNEVNSLPVKNLIDIH